MTTMAKAAVDYSLYLVTGRELLPAGVDYFGSLEASLSGGDRVTVVQLREKHADTAEFLEIAKRSFAICDKHGVPMLINDNLSVALALPPRVGLHIGQTDLPLAEARRLLGPERLLGISVHNVEQARAVLAGGIADYAGVGPCHGTQSKAGIGEKDVLGPRGTREVVAALASADGKRRVPCVLIGGLNQTTAQRTLYGATSEVNHPDGIAVISAIVGRKDADVAASELSSIVGAFKAQLPSDVSPGKLSLFDAGKQWSDTSALLKRATQIFAAHRQSTHGPPLIQTLTSHVSSTLSANVALCFSASPIMSHQDQEAEDLARATGAVVLNIGTIGEEARRGMKAVGAAANRGGKPVVLDPVGVGASAFRRAAVEEIMDDTQVTLLKGNSAELSSIAGLSEVTSRGVDSGSGSLKDPEGLVRSLARKERCLVLLSGKVDYLSDGHLVVRVENGHELLGKITGSGCALGVTIAAGLAAACNVARGDSIEGLSTAMVRAHPQDLIPGALVGILAMTIASELAAARQDVKGPGTFIPALLDELASITPEMMESRAKVSISQ